MTTNLDPILIIVSSPECDTSLGLFITNEVDLEEIYSDALDILSAVNGKDAEIIDEELFEKLATITEGLDCLTPEDFALESEGVKFSKVFVVTQSYS
jgi:hypothetical protein